MMAVVANAARREDMVSYDRGETAAVNIGYDAYGHFEEKDRGVECGPTGTHCRGLSPRAVAS
jgi:hypothetical protein